MPPVSEQQRKAMYAAAAGKSRLGIPKAVGKEFIASDASQPIAAGTAFVSPETKVLLLKRAGVEGVDNYVSHWSLPGGKAEPGETPEQAADRESAEELGNTAPVSKKKLLDRVKTPNGMVFHTFAQPVHAEFQPQLNEEHTECGWFALNELPSPLHPSVGRVLRENLGVAEDMQPEDWDALRENFAKWTHEEETEPEHDAEDNQPMTATTGNTGLPLAALGRKLAKKKVDKAFDMALFMRGMLAGDEGFNEGDHPRAPDGKFGTGSGSGSKSGKGQSDKGKGPGPNGAKSKEAKADIKMSALQKKSGRLGSNEGGIYEGGGEKFYIKKPPTRAHVTNERMAAKLYDLAGARTLDYREVEGGEHVATEFKALEKKNIKDFTPVERKEAAHDFAIHAWLSNWDAAGTGGDNQGVLEGKTTTLDVGGALRFRAQGGPKGSAFGDKVTEWDTMRDKGMSPDAARLFAPMTESELKSSVERVTAIPDAKIRAAVGDDKELADRLIARKKNLASKVGLATDALSPMLKAWRKRAAADAVRAKRADACPLCGGTGELAGPGSKCDECGGTGLIAQDEVLAFDRAMVMGLHREGLAFDRQSVSVRRTDADGRLHVEVSNISKATVNPYMGKEIPKYKELGLEPEKIYQLLRDPSELEKAAPSFNNLPLLDEHVGVNAANHRPEHVIGSTGTDAVFEHPHLRNSLVVWADKGIKAIESEKKKQLSSAYRYRADMTPGDYEGVRYHGVMRDIVGNHVCIVEEGRAGEDVVVGDSANPLTKGKLVMSKKALLSSCATVAHGALMVFLQPQLAQDAQIDLKKALAGVTGANFKSKRAGVRTAIMKMVDGHLEEPEFAQDGSLKMGLDAVLDMVEKAKDDFPDDMEKKKDAKAEDEDMEDETAEDEEAETDEEKAARMEARAKAAKDKKAKDKKAKDAKGKDMKPMAGAKDKDVNEEDEEHDPKTPEETANDEDDAETAMDAKIQAGIDAGIKKERDRMEGVSVAKEHVRARVGALANLAFDSAAEVYAKAIELAAGKKPPKGADVAMLKFAFDQLPPKDGGNNRKQTYAMDSSVPKGATGAIAERNPDLAKNLQRISRQ